jgi:hypothetical protein
MQTLETGPLLNAVCQCVLLCGDNGAGVFVLHASKLVTPVLCMACILLLMRKYTQIIKSVALRT